MRIIHRARPLCQGFRRVKPSRAALCSHRNRSCRPQRPNSEGTHRHGEDEAGPRARGTEENIVAFVAVMRSNVLTGDILPWWALWRAASSLLRLCRAFGGQPFGQARPQDSSGAWLGCSHPWRRAVSPVAAGHQHAGRVGVVAPLWAERGLAEPRALSLPEL
jgi:hypothetical protein